jgi:hypothetical protein
VREHDPVLGEIGKRLAHEVAPGAVLVAGAVDERAEEFVSLAVESRIPEARVEPGGIGQKRRVVFGVEVGAEIRLACLCLLGIYFQEATCIRVVLARPRGR